MQCNHPNWTIKTHATSTWTKISSRDILRQLTILASWAWGQTRPASTSCTGSTSPASLTRTSTSTGGARWSTYPWTRCWTTCEPCYYRLYSHHSNLMSPGPSMGATVTSSQSSCLPPSPPWASPWPGWPAGCWWGLSSRRGRLTITTSCWWPSGRGDTSWTPASPQPVQGGNL